MKNYTTQLIATFLGLFAVVVISSQYLSGARLDLSENGLYTLSEGTQNIVERLEQDVTIELYFSDKATTQLPALRTYAKRVEELLVEYQSLSNGKITFSKIDPQPFSEAEDSAALAGLQAVPGGPRGEDIYFGLVAKNAADKEEVIPFIQPDKEAFLEYDLTRLISSLSRAQLPKVGIYSGIEIQGGFDYTTRQSRPEWAVLQYINDNFEIEWIADDQEVISGIDLLLLIAPQELSEPLEFAIDQFVMGGGKTIAFVDPYIETMSQLSGMPSVQRADIADLMANWGVKLKDDAFIGDFDNSMVVSMGQGRSPARHIGLLSLRADTFAQDDVVLFGLESLNLSSVGVLEAVEGAGTDFEPIISSSEQAQLKSPELLTTLHDPSDLLSGFEPTGERYTIAARVSGPAKTMFPQGIEIAVPLNNEASDGESDTALNESETPETEIRALAPKHLESDNIQLLVVADSDVLGDRLWVQVQNFFGQQIVTPWADNGSFLLNAVENFSGEADLISIRSQGRFSRPFEKVDALRRNAEERLLAQQELLEEELQSTEDKLMDLESMRDESDGALFSEEQEAELLQFQEEKLKIRKQLRDVQHQLDQDIEQLGTRLKLINILLVPALVCVYAVMMSYRRRRYAM